MFAVQDAKLDKVIRSRTLGPSRRRPAVRFCLKLAYLMVQGDTCYVAPNLSEGVLTLFQSTERNYLILIKFRGIVFELSITPKFY